jgi:hypothetical protein
MAAVPSRIHVVGSGVDSTCPPLNKMVPFTEPSELAVIPQLSKAFPPLQLSGSDAPGARPGNEKVRLSVVIGTPIVF